MSEEDERCDGCSCFEFCKLVLKKLKEGADNAPAPKPSGGVSTREYKS